MAVNALRPAWTKIRYTVGGHVHTMTFSCQPQGVPEAGIMPGVQMKSGTYVAWGVALVALCNVLKPVLDETSSIDYAEFWYQPTADVDPVFIMAQTLAVAGTNAGDHTFAMESVITFRTAAKGGFKLYVLEAVGAVDDFKPIGSTGYPAIEALAAYVVSSAGWLLARNNQFPIVGLNYSTKTNDVLRDKYLRP